MSDGKTAAELQPFLGSIWEQVAKRIFSARLHPTRNFKKGELNPDLESKTYSAWIEVKSSRTRYAFQLIPRQMERYAVTLKEGSCPFPAILFAFFTHSLDGIVARYGSSPSWMLARDLINRAKHLVVLDLCIVEHIVREESAGVRQFGGYSPAILWPQKVNARLLKNPEDALRSLGLVPDSFFIAKRMVTVRFGSTKKRIPSVWVLRADHLAAQKQLR